MVLVEMFVYAQTCGRAIYYTSTSFTADGSLFMIDWRLTADDTPYYMNDRYRDRNRWRKVICD